MIIFPSTTAGEAVMLSSVSKLESSLPSFSRTMYSRPSFDPTITLPPHTTGELFTCPRVLKVHTTLPLSRRTQCSRLSSPPNSTRSFVSAGEDE